MWIGSLGIPLNKINCSYKHIILKIKYVSFSCKLDLEAEFHTTFFVVLVILKLLKILIL